MNDLKYKLCKQLEKFIDENYPNYEFIGNSHCNNESAFTIKTNKGYVDVCVIDSYMNEGGV